MKLYIVEYKVPRRHDLPMRGERSYELFATKRDAERSRWRWPDAFSRRVCRVVELHVLSFENNPLRRLG